MKSTTKTASVEQIRRELKDGAEELKDLRQLALNNLKAQNNGPNNRAYDEINSRITAFAGRHGWEHFEGIW